MDFGGINQLNEEQLHSDPRTTPKAFPCAETYNFVKI